MDQGLHNHRNAASNQCQVRAPAVPPAAWGQAKVCLPELANLPVALAELHAWRVTMLSLKGLPHALRVLGYHRADRPCHNKMCCPARTARRLVYAVREMSHHALRQHKVYRHYDVLVWYKAPR
eukprot:scaffold83955_cov65-Phaeocystis_antarctica.AAC.2